MVVYTHEKPNGEIFYVGVGNVKRPYSFIKKGWGARSKAWWNIVDKYGYPIVKIVCENLSSVEALEKEKELIKLYGRRDLNEGSLVNHTDGGDGVWNWGSLENREERKKKISNSVKKWHAKRSEKSYTDASEKRLKTLDPEKRSEINRRALKTFWNNASEEKKTQRMKKLHSHESMKTEKRSQRAREFRSKYSSEKNKMMAEKRETNMTEERKKIRAEKVKFHLNSLTPEEKRERKRKAWETRREKQQSPLI